MLLINSQQMQCMKGSANMPNKVVTMCNASYFHYGDYFVDTRKKVDAEFHLFGPDLTSTQQIILSHNDIIYHPVVPKIFEFKMQYLKFDMLMNVMDKYESNEIITWCDFDTWFSRDWNTSLKKECDDFDFGITYREPAIKSADYYCLSNGGVFFVRNHWRSKELLKYAQLVMNNGGDINLEEYDEIFKILEDKSRPARKICDRFNLRWDVDQVFLSALVLYHIKNNTSHSFDYSFKFLEYNIELLDCRLYNNMYNSKNADSFIYHLKKSGRTKLKRNANK